MKTVGEILAIIDSKIKEHTKEIEEVDEKLYSKNNITDQGMEQQLKRISLTMVLKDKIIFHKAAAAALQDLKESINGRN